ncbi:MAG: hypothetical protein HXP18_01100 [Veillonella sp.]|nr:hypothetical protein [Veillonella sp.]
MDIQSVIISFNELNNTKNAIANAIRGKGISSSGRFANFASEISSIQAGIGGSDYKKLMDNLGKYNVFRKGNDNRLSAIGTVKEKHEVVADNSVTIYSLYAIDNIRVADGQYKSRVKQTVSNKTYQLTADGQDCGNVSYYKLNLGVTPQEADNPNGSVNITYTTNGQDYTVTMPIKDNKTVKPHDNTKTVYWLVQDIFNPDVDNKDLRQTVSVNDFNNRGATFHGRFNGFQTYKSRPAIFDKLNTVMGYNMVDAILTLNKNGNMTEAIPVKLARNVFAEAIALDGGGNGAVLEFDGSNLVFHYSDTEGKLGEKFIISTTGSTSKTDASIVNKIKELKKDPNGYLGIAIYSDGSPITIAEAKAAGML